MRRAFELQFAPIARRLGWRPEFEWARLQAWIDRNPNMRVIERKPMPPLGHFSMMRFGKTGKPA
jgi:phosphatidylethanolamine/phosphatidyl-N-methylethanolamine N-methyltransferase